MDGWFPGRKIYTWVCLQGRQWQQTIPFLYKGLPVEYEIVRTINAVSGSQKKKTLGVFATDAPVLGTAGMGIMGFNLGGGTPAWEFFNELNKQYDVQEVTGGEISPNLRTYSTPLSIPTRTSPLLETTLGTVFPAASLAAMV